MNISDFNAHSAAFLNCKQSSMSAIESPTPLNTLWQDPWACAVTATAAVTGTTADDFYGQQANKGMMNQAAFYHHQPMVPQGYHPGHPIMEGGQNNNNNSMNSDTTSSASSGVSADKKPHRQVNFKLDIKSEPDLTPVGVNGIEHPYGGMPNPSSGGMQKVPSISDLSDPDSSLDIPCSQVRIYHLTGYQS